MRYKIITHPSKYTWRHKNIHSSQLDHTQPKIHFVSLHAVFSRNISHRDIPALQMCNSFVSMVCVQKSSQILSAAEMYLEIKFLISEMCIVSLMVVSLLRSWRRPLSKVFSLITTVNSTPISSYLQGIDTETHIQTWVHTKRNANHWFAPNEQLCIHYNKE